MVVAGAKGSDINVSQVSGYKLFFLLSDIVQNSILEAEGGIHQSLHHFIIILAATFNHIVIIRLLLAWDSKTLKESVFPSASGREHCLTSSRYYIYKKKKDKSL